MNDRWPGVWGKKLSFPSRENLDYDNNIDLNKQLDLSDLDVLKSARSEDYFSTPLSTFRYNSEETFRSRDAQMEKNLGKSKSSATSQTILNSLIGAISSVQQDQSSSSKLVQERESLVSLVHDLQAKVSSALFVLLLLFHFLYFLPPPSSSSSSLLLSPPLLSPPPHRYDHHHLISVVVVTLLPLNASSTSLLPSPKLALPRANHLTTSRLRT